MRLYKYEIGSDDDEIDVIEYKRLVVDAATLEGVIQYIHRYYAPQAMLVTVDRIIDGHIVLTAVPDDAQGEFDEVLWLIGE